MVGYGWSVCPSFGLDQGGKTFKVSKLDLWNREDLDLQSCSLCMHHDILPQSFAQGHRKKLLHSGHISAI